MSAQQAPASSTNTTAIHRNGNAGMRGLDISGDSPPPEYNLVMHENPRHGLIILYFYYYNLFAKYSKNIFIYLINSKAFQYCFLVNMKNRIYLIFTFDYNLYFDDVIFRIHFSLNLYYGLLFIYKFLLSSIYGTCIMIYYIMNVLWLQKNYFLSVLFFKHFW